MLWARNSLVPSSIWEENCNLMSERSRDAQVHTSKYVYINLLVSRWGWNHLYSEFHGFFFPFAPQLKVCQWKQGWNSKNLALPSAWLEESGPGYGHKNDRVKQSKQNTPHGHIYLQAKSSIILKTGYLLPFLIDFHAIIENVVVNSPPNK